VIRELCSVSCEKASCCFADWVQLSAERNPRTHMQRRHMGHPEKPKTKRKKDKPKTQVPQTGTWGTRKAACRASRRQDAGVEILRRIRLRAGRLADRRSSG
jgi:hypothetical protein